MLLIFPSAIFIWPIRRINVSSKFEMEKNIKSYKVCRNMLNNATNPFITLFCFYKGKIQYLISHYPAVWPLKLECVCVCVYNSKTNSPTVLKIFKHSYTEHVILIQPTNCLFFQINHYIKREIKENIFF